MPRMHNANGRRNLHAMYRDMGDKQIHTPRYGSATTRKAIRTAKMIRDAACGYGHTCDRVLLVFVDDHATPDRLACIVLSLDGKSTLVLDVENGNVISKKLYDIPTNKRLPRDFMYAIAHEIYYPLTILRDGKERKITAPAHDLYHTKVYARNLCCYEE